MIYRQWNRLEDALKHARRGLEISEAWGQADVIIIGMYQLAKVLASIGKNKDAISTINKAKLMAANMPEIYKEMVETWQVRIHEMCGDHTAGARWIRDNTLDSLDQSLRPMWKSMVIVRVLISQARYQECVNLTKDLLKITAESGAQGYEITLLILLTKCYLELGEKNQAIQTLEKAVRLAEPENNIQDFIEDGNRPVNTLLKKWIESNENAKFALKITKAHQQEKKSEKEMPLTSLITPLSNRELEVLELLATECSPTDIAAQLFISVSTVNSHIRNIYGKLGVNKRYEAVKLANELRIIDYRHSEGVKHKTV
jgi:LuxR family maltose regulon positive regulatory protein